MLRSLSLFTTTLSVLLTLVSVHADITSYPNLFEDPRFLLNKHAWNPKSVPAQNAIVGGADWLAGQGPWGMYYLLASYGVCWGII